MLVCGGTASLRRYSTPPFKFEQSNIQFVAGVGNNVKPIEGNTITVQMTSKSAESGQKKTGVAAGNPDEAMDRVINGLIFDVVLDYLREEYGYPGAMPLRELMSTNPAVPRPPLLLQRTLDQETRRSCPCCGQAMELSSLGAHMMACRKTISHDKMTELLTKSYLP